MQRIQHLFNKLDRPHIRSAFTRSARFIVPLIIANASLLTSHAVIRDTVISTAIIFAQHIYNVFPSDFFFTIPFASSLQPLCQIARFRYADFRACAFLSHVNEWFRAIYDARRGLEPPPLPRGSIISRIHRQICSQIKTPFRLVFAVIIIWPAVSVAYASPSISRCPKRRSVCNFRGAIASQIGVPGRTNEGHIKG